MDVEEIIKFGEYLSLTLKLSDLTVEKYLRFFKLLDLTLIDNQEYVNAFLQNYHNDSVVRGMMLNLLRFKGLHKKIDMPPRPTGRKVKRIIRDIAEIELKAFREMLYESSFKEGLVFDLMYQGALRRFELPPIRINSFYWLDWFENQKDLCKLKIDGKGKKQRTVLINPETAKKILDYYLERYPEISILEFVNSDTLLFANTKGDALSDKVIYYIIKRKSKKYLGRDIRPHELRHKRATELLNFGVHIRDIKNYLGHTNLTTTEIYLHQAEEESIDNIKKLIPLNQ